MRILHVTPWYRPAWRYGGPIQIMHGLCKRLVERGHDVHVFSTDIDGAGHLNVQTETPVVIDGVKVRYFGVKHLRRLCWAPRMTSALRNEVPGFDLLHLHSVYLWPTTAAATVARRADVPYILTPYGMLAPVLINGKSSLIKKAWIAAVEHRNLAGAAVVHFTSKQEATQTARLGLLFRAACVVPCGVDEDEWADEDGSFDLDSIPGLSQRSRFLLFLGRVSWEKGIERLIVALTIVPDCFLVVAGNDETGYQSTLEEVAAKWGVRERVVFVGPVYGARKKALLQHALALILPSYSESFGMVVLEAFAARCAVVVTPEVGAAEVVREVGGGIVVNGDPQVLGSGIRALVSDTARLETMRYRAHSAIARYNWRTIAGEMEEVYKSIVQIRRRAGL